VAFVISSPSNAAMDSRRHATSPVASQNPGPPCSGDRGVTQPMLAYEVHPGTGPYLLLVHGLLSGRAQWLPNLDALSGVSRPVVVELLGHGRSPSPGDARLYTPEAYVEHFDAVRRAVGAERWVVCGQSLGAALTLRYALDRPGDVLAQVFTNSNSALAPPGWAEENAAMFERGADQLLRGGRAAIDNHPLNPRRGRRLPAAARDALAAATAEHDPRGVALTLRHTVPASPVTDRLDQVRVPSLLVVGVDEAGFADARRRAEDAIPALEVVETAAGHAVNLEDPVAFNRAVVGFLRGRSGWRARPGPRPPSAAPPRRRGGSR